MGEFRRPTVEKGVQRIANDLRGNFQPVSEKDTAFEPPHGVSDESSAEESGVRRSSRQTKNKEPKCFGDPIKHSIKEVSADLSGGHYSRWHFKNTGGGLGTSKNEVIGQSKLRMLERHLFRQKFGYATLDKGVDWNPSWKKTRIERSKNVLQKAKLFVN